MIKRKDALTIKPPALPESNSGIHQNLDQLSDVDRLDIHFMDGLYVEVLPFVNALIREDTVSGSLAFDKAYAAKISKEFCEEKGDKVLAALSEAEHGRLLSWVLRRHQASPAQRLAIAKQVNELNIEKAD
jgi:hypothetical protein